MVEQQQKRDSDGYPFPPDLGGRLRKVGVHASKRLLRLGIYLVMSVIGCLLWLKRRGKPQPPLNPDSFHPRHILVIRLDLIGDLVLSLTIVRALKRTYPEAEIDLLALPSSAPIALYDSDITQIMHYDPNVWRRPKGFIQRKNWDHTVSLLRQLQHRHYDLAVSVCGDWAALLAVASGAKRRVGFGQESFPGFMTDSVAGYHWKPGDHQHEVDYCLQLAKAAGVLIQPEDRIPHLAVDPQASQEIEQILEQEGVQQDKPLIACHVSSNNGQSKRWPIPYWATLLDRLLREDRAYIVITGAPNDLPLVKQVIERMHQQPMNLAGKTSLIQLAALLQRAHLVIGGDSGPMHIAAAVGTPLIAIHGPTDPVLSRPVSPRVTVIRSDIWCSPCYNARDTADCRFYTTQCMKNITPTQIFELVQSKLLDQKL